MPHRGWRIGSGSAESAPADRLTPDRLAGFLSFLRSVSPESSDQSQPDEAFEQTPVTGADPQAAKPRVADSSPGARPAEAAPTLAATSVARVGAPEAAPAAPAKTDAATSVARAATESSGGALPAVVWPVAVAPAEAVRAVVEPAIVESSNAPNNARPTSSKKGRHRPPGSAHHGIRGIAFTARSLAVLGALTVVVVATVVLVLI